MDADKTHQLAMMRVHTITHDQGLHPVLQTPGHWFSSITYKSYLFLTA
jgi:hypothetical protein